MNSDSPKTLQWADEQIAKHRAAIADLEAFKRVISADTDSPKEQGVRKPNPFHIYDPQARGAKKYGILKALAATTHGMNTRGIVAALQSGGMVGTTQENTSPQLSLYRGDGLIVLDHGVWKITPKGTEYLQEFEAQRGQT